MSKDTIYRQDAINEVINWLKERMTNRKNGKPLTDRLKELPSVQPERETGYWREAARYPYRICSKCDAAMYLYEPCKPNYCPNCGADMRG